MVWNWYHFVAIVNLHQPHPTDSADINTWLQLSDTSSIPPMHGGFLLLPTFCLLFSLQLIYYQTAFYTSNLNRIVVLQKKVIRIICKMKPQDSCESKYSELYMMRFLDINVYMISKFMFHVCKGEVPSIFGTYFQANWQCNYFHLPVVKRNRAKTNIRYRGAVIWNRILSCGIDPDISEAVFVKLVKQIIVNGVLNM